MAVTLTPDLTNEYTFLFNTCIIKPTKLDEIDGNINKMVANKATYEAVGNQLNIPWHFIAIIHCLEASLSFHTHLHNGDPLTSRTVQVPRGRPVKGNPPFSWQESAIDALTLEGFVGWSDWSVAGMLFLFEKFNGFGYRKKGINTPYLWSFSNHYIKGKFTNNGIFDLNAVSKQCGAAVLLRRINEMQLTLGETDPITLIRELGELVTYDPNNFNQDAQRLQNLLNGVGLQLRSDGKAGDRTSEAYEHISGKFLHGDARRI
jgi:lysozyme family protein